MEESGEAIALVRKFHLMDSRLVKLGFAGCSHVEGPRGFRDLQTLNVVQDSWVEIDLLGTKYCTWGRVVIVNVPKCRALNQMGLFLTAPPGDPGPWASAVHNLWRGEGFIRK
ncbi:uncharacterized protein B0T23DRAFT_377565 [Neurospora hispaniola]|uniref:Uncharacterized protein n=1 Tax=Neurospora hispaniola TaxID=588809 RepID=A0AAJ0IAB3_9PEZI|nr:hypothetical protein B0T23DRAFT_377565 [Neurospora hispaniola]